ncbi:hypothetical protein [Streptomyces sp. NPDC002402]
MTVSRTVNLSLPLDGDGTVLNELEPDHTPESDTSLEQATDQGKAPRTDGSEAAG